MREKLMLLWWRAWHLRNNSILGDGKAGITQSTHFLKNYKQLSNNREEGNISEDIKGKKPMFEIKEIKPERRNKKEKPDGKHQTLGGNA
jgi:hypothetical protein